jgi:hypothetical protein
MNGGEVERDRETVVQARPVLPDERLFEDFLTFWAPHTVCVTFEALENRVDFLVIPPRRQSRCQSEFLSELFDFGQRNPESDS